MPIRQRLEKKKPHIIGDPKMFPEFHKPLTHTMFRISEFEIPSTNPVSLEHSGEFILSVHPREYLREYEDALP